MGWVELAVVEVRCDVCGQVAVGDEDARWFTDRAVARDILAGLGWMFTADAVRCADCVQAAACALVGHDPGEWVDRAYEWYVGRTRACSACGFVEAEPMLPVGAGGG